jgi:NAD(P)-dependent dehydrogenase (short-subunit alcohol dehydrogenase family)
MAKLKKKTIIFGSSGDIGKKIKQILNKDKILEINSKNLDLGNLELVENFRTNFIPDNIIFVSAKNNPKDFLSLNDKEIQEIFNINFISFIKILRKLLRKIIKAKKKCKIIIITSLYSKFGRSQRALYSISKHALLGLTRNLAVELGPKGITVNAISPGYVDTKMTRKNLTLKQINFLKSKTPLKKIISPRDIALTVKTLLDNETKSITGQEIIIDGGISINGSFGL